MSADLLKTKHTELNQLVQSTHYNFNNLVNKNTKSSATRYRAELMKITKLAGELRKLTLEFQKSLPTKSRKKAAAQDEESDEGVPDKLELQREASSVLVPASAPPSPVKKTKRRLPAKKK